MIISRTPLRVSFCGGGTDLPGFYRRHGSGAVLSTGIARYVYLSMHAYFEREGYILKYSQLESPKDVTEIQHRIIRQVFTDLKISRVDFNSSADVPAGTGMGSSSAFTVGLLTLCNAYLGRYESRAVLAEKACEIELEKLGEPIGKQDQYGCALGGLNLIEFHSDESVTFEAVPLSLAGRRALEENLVMFYLGGTRSASALLEKQAEGMESSPQVVAHLKAMAQQARDLRGDLMGGVDVLGPYLHEAWERKRVLADGISNPQVDQAYARARAAGATGGKLLGAGSSGFLLVYAPSGHRQEVEQALQDYEAHDVRIDSMGTTIVYSD